ncbi:MAG: hypothetical protein JWN72_1108, partial [Thermoleophilia bacterium]|nr:hypothetical protein [Thermoleophilia bacterium]
MPRNHVAPRQEFPIRKSMLVAGIAAALTLGFAVPGTVLHLEGFAGSTSKGEALLLPPTPEQATLADVREHVAAKLQSDASTANRPGQGTLVRTTDVATKTASRKQAVRKVAQETPCTDKVRTVTRLGRACHVSGGQWKMKSSSGREMFTHGFDPTPEAAAQASVASSMFALAAGDGAGRAAAGVVASLDASNGVDAALPDGTVGDIDCAEAGELAHQIYYVRPYGQTDRTSTVSAQIRQNVYDASAFLDQEARSVDPTRHLRIKFRCSAGEPSIVTVELPAGNALTFYDIVDAINGGDALNGPLMFLDIAAGGEGGIAETYRGNGASTDDPDSLSNTGNLVAQIFSQGGTWSAY